MLASLAACLQGDLLRGARAQRHTESDREVEDEATPQHAGDGLDGHFESICGCVAGLGVVGLLTGTVSAFAEGKLALEMRLLAKLSTARRRPETSALQENG